MKMLINELKTINNVIEAVNTYYFLPTENIKNEEDLKKILKNVFSIKIFIDDKIYKSVTFPRILWIGEMDNKLGFSFEELSEDEIERKKIYSKLDYLAMMLDIDLDE